MNRGLAAGRLDTMDPEEAPNPRQGTRGRPPALVRVPPNRPAAPACSLTRFAGISCRTDACSGVRSLPALSAREAVRECGPPGSLLALYQAISSRSRTESRVHGPRGASRQAQGEVSPHCEQRAATSETRAVTVPRLPGSRGHDQVHRKAGEVHAHDLPVPRADERVFRGRPKAPSSVRRSSSGEVSERLSDVVVRLEGGT